MSTQVDYLKWLRETILNYVNSNSSLLTDDATLNKPIIDRIQILQTYILSEGSAGNYQIQYDLHGVKNQWRRIRNSTELQGVIMHLTAAFKLRCLMEGALWSDVVKHTAEAMTFQFNIPVKTESNEYYDVEFARMLPDSNNVLKAHQQNDWLVVVSLINIMGTMRF